MIIFLDERTLDSEKIKNKLYCNKRVLLLTNTHAYFYMFAQHIACALYNIESLELLPWIYI